VLSGAVTFRPGARVVCFISGGNADPAVLARALEGPA
jgi:hypothetical protein